MDKVGIKNTQALPLWERGKPSQGHRSAVDGALKAHRQRSFERQQRVQDRLETMGGVQNEFFPGPQIDNLTLNNEPYRISSERLNMESTQNAAKSVAGQNPEVQSALSSPLNLPQPEMDNVPQNPMVMDDIYRDAQLGSVKNQALAEVEQEVENPQHGPVDDIPKGSYVDYEV